MTYDLGITVIGNGPVRFKVPDITVAGVVKLSQRVMTVLLADDGEMIKLAGGRATTSALNSAVLARERSRVLDTIINGTPDDAPADETLSQLELTQNESSGTAVSVNVEVTAVSGIKEEITLKL